MHYIKSFQFSDFPSCHEGRIRKVQEHKNIKFIFRQLSSKYSLFDLVCPANYNIDFSAPVGLQYERGGDARRKFWTKPKKETNLGVAQAFLPLEE